MNFKERKRKIMKDARGWNNSDEIRAFLFMDILRPLKFPGNVLNRAILNFIERSSYIQDAKKNQEIWEEKYSRGIPETVA